MTFRLKSHEIMTRVRAPVPAATVEASMPDAARLFCPPFRKPNEQGVLLFPLTDFAYNCDGESLALRVRRSDGSTMELSTRGKEWPQVEITVDDVCAKWAGECRAHYAELLSGRDIPETVDLESAPYPNNLLVAQKVGDGSFVIQVWLGLILCTEPDWQILVTEPSMYGLKARHHRCVPGIIDSDRWRGWPAAVISVHPTRGWVEVSADEAICQVLPYRTRELQLEHRKLAEADQDALADALSWHDFDVAYRAGKRPGKYQRQLAGDGQWDCDWKSALEFERGKASRVTPQDTVSRENYSIATETKCVDGTMVLVVESPMFTIEFADTLFLEFFQHLANTTRFSVQDALNWHSPSPYTWEQMKPLFVGLIENGALNLERSGRETGCPYAG